MPENDVGSDDPHAGDSTSFLSFDQKISHLASGYSNGQATVRFLDTKAAAVIGGVPVLLGVLFATFGWLQKCEVEFTTLVFWIIALAALISLALAALAISHAFWALSPRDPAGTKPSVVFPFQSTGFETRLDQMTEKPVRADAVEDYRRQILRMGTIVAIKHHHVARSVQFVRYLLSWSVLCVVTLVIVAARSQTALVEPSEKSFASAEGPYSPDEGQSGHAD